jgi:hypothetical protein
MEILTLKEELLSLSKKDNSIPHTKLFDSVGLKIYPKSIREYNDIIFFIARSNGTKSLYLYYEYSNSEIPEKFNGSLITVEDKNNFYFKKCLLNTNNRKVVQSIFAFTNPKVLGLEDSFGFGDRLGLANPAHVRSLRNSKFKPILAQQSIRELTRSNRTPADVMDAAVWAVFQEGYTDGFGADADHLKTEEDIDLMVNNDFRMFTFDPGDYVHNDADMLNNDELENRIVKQVWDGLNTNYDELSNSYLGREIIISEELKIQPDENKLKRAIIKYSDSLALIKKMFDHLKLKYPDYESEVEVSIDETESVTSLFEHYFISNELKRLGIDFISLAPRFIGEFEKGIDYKGDLNIFKQEYIKHASIALYFGTYKLSLHSGSDKFGVYKVIGSLNLGATHVKTAGTSYLEALKVAALKEPDLMREILDYSRNLYEEEKKTYYVSADLEKVKPAKDYSDEDLVMLFNQDDWRQILHVTYGRILTDKNEQGKYIFKDRLLNCINSNEEIHYKLLFNHFRKHLDNFN